MDRVLILDRPFNNKVTTEITTEIAMEVAAEVAYKDISQRSGGCLQRHITTQWRLPSGYRYGWVQAVKDNTAKEDLNRADNIVYIGQPTVKGLKNLAELSELIRRQTCRINMRSFIL